MSLNYSESNRTENHETVKPPPPGKKRKQLFREINFL
uniref:Uncharacterized protein n=1 Tax=Rhizophora mucronata TaxID=61149 RepID=A0A2P2J361_RHIMU